MANIISIGTALPVYCHPQNEILHFMQNAYGLDEADKRKLAFLYSHSGIKNRYSVIEDFGKPGGGWSFIPNDSNEAFPLLDKRMEVFQKEALPLSIKAIDNCIDGLIEPVEITHLITVSCTGMSAPGLDLEIVEEMELPPNVFRTSVNFMGCYAAVHALKLAKMICDSTPSSNVIIVATELCTLHFQKKYTLDNAASSLLFGDGSAAVLISNNIEIENALQLKSFYSEVSFKGKNEMSWQLSKDGFLMSLSSYVPALIEENIAALVQNALLHADLTREDITHWCLHPGGRKILEVIQKQMGLCDCAMKHSAKVLSEYGNMSSVTILFVLKEIMQSLNGKNANIFGVAFGPGLTMETFTAKKAL